MDLSGSKISLRALKAVTDHTALGPCLPLCSDAIFHPQLLKHSRGAPQQSNLLPTWLPTLLHSTAPNVLSQPYRDAVEIKIMGELETKLLAADSSQSSIY